MATATISFQQIQENSPLPLTEPEVKSLHGSIMRLIKVHGHDPLEALTRGIRKYFYDDSGRIKERHLKKIKTSKPSGVGDVLDQKISESGNSDPSHSSSISPGRSQSKMNMDLFLAVLFGLLSVGMTYLLIRAGMVVFGDHREGILKAALLEISIPVLHCIPYAHPVAKALQNILIAVCIACSLFVIHSATDINKFKKIESTFQVSKIASSLNAANSMVLSEQRKQNSGKRSYISRSTNAAKAVKRNADAVKGLMASTGFNDTAAAEKWTDLAIQGIMLILNVIFSGQAIMRLRRVL